MQALKWGIARTPFPQNRTLFYARFARPSSCAPRLGAYHRLGPGPVCYLNAQGQRLENGTHPPRFVSLVCSRCGTLWLVCLLLSCLLLCGFAPATLVDREIAPTERLTVGELHAWAEVANMPGLSARAWVLYDADTDQILDERNDREPLPPASLTKLMTALLVLEQNDLETRVTIEKGDLVGGATMGLEVGETLSVEELLWGLLLPSGNDAAMALARKTAGSVDNFVQRMNERAKELGLTQTKYVNPHGLDATGHVTSAKDLLTLTKMLWRYPLFRQIVGATSVTAGGHALRNTNELLATLPGTDGIKTGTTTKAGECLVASVDRNGHQVLIVILGSQDRYGDADKLYGLYRTGYSWVQPDPGELSVLNRLVTSGGHVWYLDAQGSSPTMLVRLLGDSAVTSFRRLNVQPRQQLRSGMDVGELEWKVADRVVGIQKLVIR